MAASPSTPAFGTLLRRYRKAAGLTQEELAEHAGMSVQGIADLETGRRRSPRRDTVELLAAALGLTGPDRAAFEAVARQKITSALARPADARRSGDVVGGTRLVGRMGELALIDRHLDGSGPPLLVFAGEPGIGKSRLLREAALRAEGLGWEVLAGGCHRRSGQEPYTPLLTALERHLSVQSTARQREYLRDCGWMVRLLPELAESGVVPSLSASLAPEHERRLMFAAVGRYLANIAGPRGTLLLLDDLQWSATDALDLLAALLRAPAVAPLRVLAAYRDTEVRRHDTLPSLIADLAREELAVRVPVPSLAMPDARALLDDQLGDLPDGPEALAAQADFKQRLIVRAGGVPYFLLSCAQALSAGAVAGSGSDAVSAVPSTVAETIHQRVGMLPETAQAVLAAAAIIGRTVPRTLVLRVLAQAEVAEDVALAGLDAACAARLLVEEGEHAYQFAHDLVREAVVSDLTAARRAVLHRQVAEALEQGSAQPGVEILAYHYTGAGVMEKAITYLELAGDRARDRYASAEAVAYYRELVSHLDGLERARHTARACEKLGTALAAVPAYDEALGMFERAADAYRTVNDVEGERLAAARIGELQARRGRSADGLARLQPVLASTSVGDPHALSRGLAALHLSLAHLYFVGGAYPEQLDAATRAAELAQEAGDDDVLRMAEYRRAIAMVALGQVDEGYRMMVEHVIPLAEATGDLHTLVRALTQVGAMCGAYWADFVQERQYIERAMNVAERMAEPIDIAFLTYRRGHNAFSIGKWAQARSDFERAVALMRQVDKSWFSTYPPVGLGLLRLAQGDRAAAMQALDEAVALAERIRDLQALSWVHVPLAECELLERQPESARARLAALLARIDKDKPQSSTVLTLLAWTDLEAGDAALADTALAEIVARSTAGGLRAVLLDALRVQALALTKRSRWSDAASALAQALDLSRAIQAPYAEAKVLYVYGQLHAAKGEPEQARERLEAALGILNQLGERLYAERVEQAIHTLTQARPGLPRRSP